MVRHQSYSTDSCSVTDRATWCPDTDRGLSAPSSARIATSPKHPDIYFHTSTFARILMMSTWLIVVSCMLIGFQLDQGVSANWGWLWLFTLNSIGIAITFNCAVCALIAVDIPCGGVWECILSCSVLPRGSKHHGFLSLGTLFTSYDDAQNVRSQLGTQPLHCCINLLDVIVGVPTSAHNEDHLFMLSCSSESWLWALKWLESELPVVACRQRSVVIMAVRNFQLEAARSMTQVNTAYESYYYVTVARSCFLVYWRLAAATFNLWLGLVRMANPWLLPRHHGSVLVCYHVRHNVRLHALSRLIFLAFQLNSYQEHYKTYIVQLCDNFHLWFCISFLATQPLIVAFQSAFIKCKSSCLGLAIVMFSRGSFLQTVIGSFD